MPKTSPLLALLLTLSMLSAPSALADDRSALRDAVARGELVPLISLIQRIQSEYKGEIIEVELEEDDGRWIYEIDLLAPNGAKVEFEFDARTGELLEVEGRDLDRIRR